MNPAITPPLHHGVIGNGRILALVGPDTSVDWLCLPRFDSGSIYAPLLDPEHGGRFQLLAASGAPFKGQLDYLRNTNVLRNRVELDGARFEVIDFAPRRTEGPDERMPIEYMRLIMPISGRPRLRLALDPRPDYARQPARLRDGGGMIEIDGAGASIRLYSNVPAAYLLEGREFILDRPRFFVHRYGGPAKPPSSESVRHALAVTVEGWQAWARTCALPTFHPAEVLRSALCLKLHVFEETGAIIAAATTSIPEAAGTQRTWDYRYCWLRDSAFVVEALRRLSHLREGERFITFLRDVAEAGPLQPVYGVGGERDLAEILLPHLRGYGGDGPVRVGNAACGQRQNDLCGEMMLCLQTILEDERVVMDRPGDMLPLVRRLAEEAIATMDRPDTGIWENRTVLRHHTFSRAMNWAALVRGARLERKYGELARAAAWDSTAHIIRETVLNRGYNAKLGMFTQALDGDNADASNLLLGTIGILDPRDEQFRSTLLAYKRNLVRNGLMMRYRNADDYGEPTTAFTICTFWWAEALALAGNLDEAVEVFERALKYANPLGLFSEDIDPDTGRLLGNFPQAYTHVGLINAAMTLSSLLEARDGRVSAWI